MIPSFLFFDIPLASCDSLPCREAPRFKVRARFLIFFLFSNIYALAWKYEDFWWFVCDLCFKLVLLASKLVLNNLGGWFEWKTWTWGWNMHLIKKSWNQKNIWGKCFKSWTHYGIEYLERLYLLKLVFGGQKCWEWGLDWYDVERRRFES